MTSDLADKALDNPIWSALSGRQITFSVGDDRARRYQPIYTILAGMAQYDGAGFAALNKVVDDGASVGVCSDAAFDEADIASGGFKCGGIFAVSQMVCRGLLDCKTQGMVELCDNDVAEMSALAKLTQPGPFASRTIDFGTFYGIKDGGKLVAMAGERMKVAADLDEVSAVCTHPDFQGRGMARALVHKVASNIIARGHTPFLHVRADNVAAIKSYKALGFVERKQMYFAPITKIGSPSSN